MELLERDVPLTALHDRLRSADAGNGCLLLIGGEAGVGKSTVLRRFCMTAGDGARVLQGGCDALSTPRALGPLFDLDVPAISGLLREDAPRDLLFRTVLSLISSKDRPTVLAIEDAHWADEATFDLLRFLGRRIGAARALVIVTYRDDEIGPRHGLRRVLGDLATVPAVQRLSLAPLSLAAVATLCAGSGLDPGLIHGRTGGNPFFVTEILAAGGDLPPGVHDAVIARAARLPPAAWPVLEAAAVIGVPFDLPLLESIVGSIGPELDACLAGGLLQHEAGTIRFRHDLAREAILAASSPILQARLHTRVLRALEARPDDRVDHARLAHHAEGANDRDAVLRHAPEAARRAMALRSHHEAADQYDRALRFATALPPDERAQLLEARSYACYLIGQIERAITARLAATAIWSELGDQRREGENRCHLAILYWADARTEAAKHEATRAVTILETLPPGTGLAMAYGTMARLHGTTLDDDQAIAWGERAIALAETFGATATLVDALITVGVAWLAQGKFADGHALLERGIQLAGASGLDDLAARGHANLGFGYDEHYLFDDAARYYERGIQFCIERDLDNSRLHLSAWLARCQLFLGNWITASELVNAVLGARDIAPVTEFVGFLIDGMVKTRRGYPDAAPSLDKALALALASGSLYRVGPVRAARAEAAYLAGDPARAAAEARAAYDLALAHDQRWYAGELAYWQWKGGGLAAPPGPIAEPFALQIAGDWAAAAAAWDERGCPYEAARARAESNDEPALLSALAAFETLEARPAAAVVRRRLAALGVRGVPRGPRRSTRDNPFGLTIRELDVLGLLDQQRGNQDIASRLYLSSRTVEHHVASILAKLGASTRAEAVAMAKAAGIMP